MTIAGFPYTRSFRYRVTTTMRPSARFSLRGSQSVPGRMTFTVLERGAK